MRSLLVLLLVLFIYQATCYTLGTFASSICIGSQVGAITIPNDVCTFSNLVGIGYYKISCSNSVPSICFHPNNTDCSDCKVISTPYPSCAANANYFSESSCSVINAPTTASVTPYFSDSACKTASASFAWLNYGDIATTCGSSYLPSVYYKKYVCTETSSQLLVNLTSCTSDFCDTCNTSSTTVSKCSPLGARGSFLSSCQNPSSSCSPISASNCNYFSACSYCNFTGSCQTYSAPCPLSCSSIGKSVSSCLGYDACKFCDSTNTCMDKTATCSIFKSAAPSSVQSLLLTVLLVVALVVLAL